MEPTQHEIDCIIFALDPDVTRARNHFYMQDEYPERILPPEPLPNAFWRGFIAAVVIELGIALVVWCAIGGWRLI